MKKIHRTIIETNPFKGWELCDLTLTDGDEIYDSLVQLNSIYTKLSKSERDKEIYLNFNFPEDCIVASHEKKCFAFPESINNLLGFEWDPEWEDLYGESEEEATYNALYSSVEYLIEEKESSLLDDDLP